MRMGNLIEMAIRGLSDREYRDHREHLSRDLQKLDALHEMLAANFTDDGERRRSLYADFDKHFYLALDDFVLRVTHLRNAFKSDLTLLQSQRQRNR